MSKKCKYLPISDLLKKNEPETSPGFRDPSPELQHKLALKRTNIPVLSLKPVNRHRVLPLSALPPPPKPSPTRQALLKLDRSTKIIKNNTEFSVSFDELEYHGFLGKGGFGLVTRRYHKPSDSWFAVKMIDSQLGQDQTESKDLDICLKIGNSCPYLITYFGALQAEAFIWLLTEIMDTSLDRFYANVFTLKLTMPELFISKVSFAVTSGLEHMRTLK